MADKPQFGSSRAWAAGLVLGLALFVTALAASPPSGLRRAAAKKLMERLPPATSASFVAAVGAPLSPQFDEQFARFEALAAACRDYDGTLLFVSHDRRFISLLANRLWVLESGTVHQFEGSFEEWLRATSKIPAPGQPTRGARPPKAKPPKARQEPRVKTEALERTIMDLEARVGDLERQLGEASERQDVAEVARLGREYDEVKANLDRTWAGWTG